MNRVNLAAGQLARLAVEYGTLRARGEPVDPAAYLARIRAIMDPLTREEQRQCVGALSSLEEALGACAPERQIKPDGRDPLETGPCHPA